MGRSAYRWADAVPPTLGRNNQGEPRRRLAVARNAADELRTARGDPSGHDRVFNRVPWIKALETWREAAGIEYIDSAGRRAELHAVRHTFGTSLSKTGVSPREAMSLIRHTDLLLTMNV